MREHSDTIDYWLAVGTELRRSADYFQRRAEVAIAPLGLSYAELLILYSTDDLCARVGDAVTYNDVAKETGVRKMSLSRAMRSLERRGLVDRGPSASGVAYRVIVTDRGHATLRECRGRLRSSSETLSRTLATVGERIAELKSAASG